MVKSIATRSRHGALTRLPAILLFPAVAMPAAGQQAPSVPPVAAVPAAPTGQPGVPDSTMLHKLVWAAMAAVDQANQTGNYSVLRDLGAPGFQAGTSAATLAQTFTSIRNQNIDLSYALVVTPVFQFPPAIQNGLLRIRGVFPLRPTPIGFDLLYQNVGGQWRIFGIAVIPLVAQTQQPGPTKR
jgi:hypothetical protein